jgi:hypothetical protein
MQTNFGIFVDQGNVFNQIFAPLAKKMFSEIKHANIPVVLSPDIQTFSGRKIIFGAHSNPIFWSKHSNKNDIFVNFEPVYVCSWAENNPVYCKLLQEHAVIDYSKRNIDHCGDVVVLPVPPQFHHFPKNNKENEVLFVGNPTSHRKIKLAKLTQNNVKVLFGFRLFGDQLITEISKSKIFLSINDKNQNMINLFRFALCSNSDTLFVGETDKLDEYSDFVPLIGISIFKSTEELVIGLKELLANSEKLIRAIETQNELAALHEEIYPNKLIKFLKRTL